MSTTAGPHDTSPRASGADRYATDDDRGSGWVLFAGMMLAIVGTLNFIYGIAAIDNSKFYVKDAQFIISDLNTWGWFLLFVGAVQVVSALGIWARVAGARWVGILTAAGNAVIQLMVLPAYPFLALALFTLDILVIYGLLAYGSRRTA